MKRETRANLIFITIFLALALPGIYKLTRKAYQEGGRDPAMRRPVRGEWAYMDPTPPLGLPRVAPPGVASYVKQLGQRLATMQPGLHSAIDDPNRLPVMSDHFNFQLLGSGANDGTYRVAVLGWNRHFAPLPTLYKITGRRNGTDVAGTMTSFEPIILPMELRSELRDYGYINPPESALWMIVSFAGVTPVESIRVKFAIDNTATDDVLATAAPANPTTTAPSSLPPTPPATP